MSSADGAARCEPEPEQIGPYHLLGVLGSGGMGTVYLAEQQVPVQRRVALKLIKRGMDSAAVVARFEHERQALARMSHDGIAKVLDCGTAPTGQPYFVMELVTGRPIHRFCNERRLSLSHRIVLFRQVCNAVLHAHQKGVIHRDLKPGNVLVTESNGRIKSKVIDFGLAKVLDDGSGDTTRFTEIGQVLGTPEYMSPEQAEPGSTDIDTRADIYSLGVMLYELLAGTLPFAAADLRAAGLSGLRRFLADKEPPRPSVRFATSTAIATEIADARRTSIPALQRELRAELDWIILKAIDHDRSRRYETAAALADDLQRFLDHEPLQARPPSSAYRLRKFLARNRRGLLVAGLVAATAVAGGALALGQAFAADRSRTQLASLACVLLHEQALASEQRLFPEWPDRVPQMSAWIEGAEQLRARVPDIQRTLGLLASATEATAVAAAFGPDNLQFARDRLVALLPQLERLDREVRPRVEARRRWALQLRSATADHPAAEHDWEEARRAITVADGTTASRLYDGQAIDLSPDQLVGLVPIGKNPVTGLWEFYDLRSAWPGVGDPSRLSIPRHEADGSIRTTADSGIVFVLLPGGSFRMGTPPCEPDTDRERPEHKVTVGPFLLARHELTLAQWRRLGGETTASKDVDGRLPATGMTWDAATAALSRHGLCLPTEAQWEYACRAGTTTLWSCGDDEASLVAFANVFDRSGQRYNPDHQGGTPASFDDGFGPVAPVGSFRANAFGLHDMHGNAMELCRDAKSVYTVRVASGDGLRADDGDDRIVRGGCHAMPATKARSGFRTWRNHAKFDLSTGLRPARLVPTRR